ncbi:MAG: protein tyrosine kinase [Desulfuromonas sp.]|nr:MAG: protein tyrosine kinase [Desulfuromonas sp.]
MSQSLPPSSPDFHPVLEEAHLQDYLQILLRRRRVFFITFILVFLGMATHTLMQEPIYEATATLYVASDQPRGGDFLADLGLKRESPIETEIEILKSRTNVEEVVRRLHLDWVVLEKSSGVELHLLEFEFSSVGKSIEIVLSSEGSFVVESEEGKELATGEVGRRLQIAGLTLLCDRLQGQPGDRVRLMIRPFAATVQGVRSAIRAVELGKGTNIIQLTCQHVNRERARDVINTLSAVYLERSILFKAEEARKSVDFIETQLDEVRGALNGAEQGLQSFKRDSGYVKLDSEAEVLIDRLANADRLRSELLLRQRQIEFAIISLKDALSQGDNYAPSFLLEEPVLQQLATSLSELEVERQGLLVEHTDAHPVVLQIDDRIRQTQIKILETYRGFAHAMTGQLQALGEETSYFEERLAELPAVEQELARLTRVTKVNADIYTFLLQKHEEARIARAATISSINVIDPAILPNYPIKPQKTKNLLLALVVGAILGAGVAFFLDYMDDTLKDGDAARRVFNLPLLAVIPQIARKKNGGNSDLNVALVSQRDGKSISAEAFRSLRTSLHFSSGGDKKRVLLVTSSFPGEGKTTLCANLAVTFAQTGSKVLLVGCDLRRPSLDKLFQIPRNPGLTELLIKDASVESVLRPSGIENLDVINAGTTPPNPAELLGSEAMAEIIESLRERYDHILLDAPPLLAVTDAALLSRLSDQIVMVVEAGRVPSKVATRLRETLQSYQTSVAGLVLNDKQGKATAYYGYYDEGYYAYAPSVRSGLKGLIARFWGR